MSEQYNAELIMKFQNVKSLKDYGGMDYDIAQECVEIAIKESESIAIEFAELYADAVMAGYSKGAKEFMEERPNQ